MWGNSEEDQKTKNLLLLGFWGTDKDIEEMGPFLGIILLLALLVFGGYQCYEHFYKSPEKPKAIIENSKPADSFKGDSI